MTRLLVPALLLVCQSVPAQQFSAEQREDYRTYALEHPGDVLRGERVFGRNQQLACSKCHSPFGLETVGPSMAGIADKYPRPELIKHILQPSLFIQPGYEQVIIATRRGRVHTGRLQLASPEKHCLLDADGRLIEIPAGDIEEVKMSSTSLMPDHLVAAISREEFADLIAYLETFQGEQQKGLTGPDRTVDIPRLAKPVAIRRIHPADMRFARPMDFKAIPGQPRQAVVAEQQSGIIWRLDRSVDPPLRSPFANLESEIEASSLYGINCIAFHPDYVENGRYFLFHQISEDGQVKTVIVERRASVDRRGDSGSPSIRLLEQPALSHNGGCLDFGADGMLYIGFGDAGPLRDPQGHGQNLKNFHAALLRIDVDRRDPGLNYGVPPDNPWVAARREDPAIRGELWAIGIRQPWKFSFDSLTGELWVGDVGQSQQEEVLLVRRGENHGWNVYEGFAPFSDQYRRPDEQFAFPVFAYPRTLGVSVTGGCVYRGDPASTFYGAYVFADFESRKLWGLRHQAGRLTEIREIGQLPEKPVSFGTDEYGEIYFASYEGNVSHIDLSGTRFE